MSRTSFVKLARPLVPRPAKPLLIRHQRYADQLVSGYDKLRRNQARFQVDDGCPVWLKKGWSDRLLYYATMGLCVVGMGMNFMTYYSLIWPSKEEGDVSGEEDKEQEDKPEEA